MKEIVNFVFMYWEYIVLGMFLIFCFVGIVIANTSIDNYYQVFDVYKKKYFSCAITSIDFANMISNEYFYGKIKLKTEKRDVIGTDGCYNPNNATVFISEDVIKSNSMASIAIIAHEFGHAKQHVYNSQILIKNEKLHQFVNILGIISVFLIIFAFFVLFLDKFLVAIILFGVVLINFCIALFYKFKKIKIEENASKNAIKMIDDLNVFSKKEINDIEIFLNYAKKTYVGDLFRSLFYWTGLVRKTKLF